MLQKLRFLLLALCISITGYAQVANQPGDLVVCDDTSNDGIAEFDLTVLNLEVLGGQNPADFTVTYHINQTNANNGTSAISMPYTNVTNPQLIYIRVTENSSGNFDIAFVTISVASGPSPATPGPLIVCDIDGDGFAVFDLQSTLVEVLNGEDGIVTFHETQTDAEIGVNLLPPFYNNITPFTQILYVRVEGVIANCHTVVELELLTEMLPSAGSSGSIDFCEGDSAFDLFNVLGGNPALGGEWSPLLSSGTGVWDSLIDSAGIYTYTVSGTGACTGTSTSSTVTVSINEVPEPMLEDVVMCEGSSVIVDTGLNNPNFIYSWSYNGSDIPGENASTLLINQPGAYSVIVSNMGCFGNDSFNVNQIVCEDTDDDTVDDAAEDLNGDGNLSNDDTDNDDIPNYLDDNDDGDAVLTIDEDYNGNGDPTDDDTNMNMIPDYLDADVALSLNDLAINAFKMFPNPAKDVLNLELAAGNQKVNYAIYTLEGKLVLEAVLSVNTLQQIDISSLTSGLYFVTVTSGQLETIKKLVVK